MAVEIDMSLVMDNSKYVTPLKEAQKANQDFYNQDERNKKRELGLIEDIEQELKRLEDARKKSHSTDEISKYNKKIQEAKKDLEEYNKVGIKTEEKTQSLGEKFTKLVGIWTKVIAVASSIWASLKIGIAVMESTSGGADRLRVVTQGLKTGFEFLKRSIYELKLDGLISGFFEAAREGRNYQEIINKLADKTLALQIREGDVRIEVEKLQKVYNNQELTLTERIKAIDDLLKIESKYATDSKKIAQDRLNEEVKRGAKETTLAEDVLMNLLKNYDLEIDKMEQVVAQRENVMRSLDPGQAAIKNMKDLGVTFDSTGKLILGAVDDAIKFEDQIKSIALLSPTTKQAIIDAWKTLQGVSIQEEQATERATIRKSSLLKQGADEQKKANEDLLKKYQEYLKLLEELRNKNREAEIAAMTGEEQINAQEQYQKESLDKLQAFLISEYNLEVESIDEISRAKEIVTAESNKKRLELNKQYQDEAAKNAMTWLDQQEQFAQNELELVDATEEEKLKLQIEFLKKRVDILNLQGDFIGGAIILQQVELLKKKLGALYDDMSLSDKLLKSLGFDPEQSEAIKQAAQKLFDSISEITDQRVDDAERVTDLLNDQIDQENEALQAETALLEAGYAANVRAKQNEIDQLKEQRDKALEDEKKARKLQNALDTSTQISSLVTASADIFKAFAGKTGIFGVPLAIAMIGTMFTAFLATKVQASKVTKLAAGGSGIVKGKLHSEGGERFTDHIEVEDGEAYGVLSRNATRKYGNEFHQVVKAFNRGDIKRARPNIKPIINISSDLSEKRLSSIEREMKRLNSHFANQGERTELPDKTIIRKGYSTRIIKKR